MLLPTNIINIDLKTKMIYVLLNWNCLFIYFLNWFPTLNNTWALFRYMNVDDCYLLRDSRSNSIWVIISLINHFKRNVLCRPLFMIIKFVQIIYPDFEYSSCCVILWKNHPISTNDLFHWELCTHPCVGTWFWNINRHWLNSTHPIKLSATCLT